MTQTYRIHSAPDRLIFVVGGKVRYLKGSLWEPDAFAAEPIDAPIAYGDVTESPGSPILHFVGNKSFDLYMVGASAFVMRTIGGTPQMLSGAYAKDGHTAESYLRTFLSE